MSSFVRKAYSLLLLLHPAEFRREFGYEMTLDFEAARQSYGLPALYLDLLLSIGRQWVAWANPLSFGNPRPLDEPLIAGHYTMVRHGGLSPFQLARGAALSVVLFTAFWAMEEPSHEFAKQVLHVLFSRASQNAVGAANPSPAHRIGIQDVTIVDVEHGRLEPHQTIVIIDGRIDQVGPSARIFLTKETELVDGHGKFLIPGMWDMHSHISNTAVDMPMYLANGVLGIRSMGGVEEKVFKWQKALADGTLFGPRAFVSGPILDSPTGPTEPASYAVRIANAAEGRAEVDALKAKGADLIKVYDGLSRESYFAIAEEAKKVGILFEGHVPAAVLILEATNAGQRSIEHGIEARGESTAEQMLIEKAKKEDFMAEAMRTKNFSLIPEGIARDGKILLNGFSQQKADSLYRTLAKNGTYLCPTLGVQRWTAYGDEIASVRDPRQRYISPKTLVYWQPSMNMMTKYRTPAYIEWVKVRYAQHLQQIPKQQAAGVQFLTGTDLTVPYTYPGSSVHDEMKLFVEAGLTPLQALQAGITHPVEFFGLQKSMGSVAPGKMGELVLLGANPLDDIANVERIDVVITHGKVLRRPELDAMMAVAAEVAQSK